ncbi:MAG: hypothetical protein C5B54_02820 [Acidobacteria bacterium]|nr:MAG: hypothetical protein C5B54_02820 [Acidobacteriota bacterium]
MKPLVTALVCAYNDENTIGIVLQGLKRLTYAPLQIVVIDDASTDKTPEIISQFDVTCIRNDVNRGLGHNLNLGFEKAQGEYLAVIQSDCEIRDSDWLDQMLEFMQADIGVVVSQRQIDDFASLPSGARFFNAVAPQDLKNSTGQPLEQRYCRGKADLYRISLLHELGGWNRTFFTAGEDTDLSIRIHKLGYRILLHPKASIHYLFSGRQASIAGSLKKAFLYGKTAFPLYHLYRYDGIQARTYLATLLSLVSLLLPQYARLIAGLFLFFYSWFCGIQTRGTRIPFGLLAFIASILLTVLHFSIKLPSLFTIPAAAVATAGTAYIIYLAAKNSMRNLAKGEKAVRLPATLLFCMIWRMISGAGYLAGALKNYENPSN